jgi:glycerol-3-phosphate acyltransferase PlsY
VPFGYLIARMKGIDILKVGSGNIGATNVMRVLGKRLGILVFLLDVLKGFVPALVGFYTLGHSQVGAFEVGIAAVGGHCLSPFLRFKGGKGVATGLGVLFGASPLVGLSALGIFAIVLGVTRYVSLGSIVAAISLVPLGLLFRTNAVLLGAFGAMGLFVIYRHRGNIGRLIKGTEAKFLGPKAAEMPDAPTAGYSPMAGVLVTLVGSGMLLGALSTLIR